MSLLTRPRQLAVLAAGTAVLALSAGAGTASATYCIPELKLMTDGTAVCLPRPARTPPRPVVQLPHFYPVGARRAGDDIDTHLLVPDPFPPATVTGAATGA